MEGETLWGEKYSPLQSLHIGSGKMLGEKRGEFGGETMHLVGPRVKSVLPGGKKTREEGKTPPASTRRESGEKERGNGKQKCTSCKAHAF